MHLLVVSHACVTPINQEFFAEVQAQSGWRLTLVTPRTWNGEYGLRHAERWPRFQGALLPLPVWGSGSVPLHVYRARIGALLRAHTPDAIYVHNEPYAASTAQVYLANRRSIRAPIGFFTWQNIEKQYPIPFRYTEQMVYRQSAFAISGSDSAASVLRTKGYEGPLSINPAGIDPTLFSQVPSCPTTRQELGASTTDTLIGYLGRFVPEKGLLTLLQALATIDDPSVKLALIGDGPQGDALDAAVQDLGLANRVVRRGYVPHTEAPRFLASFDLLALPSETRPNWKEQFGRVIIEALACGTPVIGSDSGEIPHLLRRTGGGWTFPEGNTSQLATLIRQLANAPEERRQRAAQGQSYVLSSYTHAALAEAFIDTVQATARTRTPQL